MQYFGGKQRISKDIVKCLSEYLEPNQTIIEPFIGGCNILDKFNGVRFAYDINEYLIEMYKALQQGWIPPNYITEEDYQYIKSNKDKDKPLTGFVGIGCSYSGKWFGGYARNKTGRNYCLNAYNSLIKQTDNIRDITFMCKDYKEIKPQNALIYCDPPYANTTKYSIVNGFDSNEFWEIMRNWSQNNTVIISEYNAPSDFICIKEIHTKLDIKNKDKIKEDRIERLYLHNTNKSILM